MPRTRGARDVAADLDLRRSCRSSVEPWTNSPIRRASRDPASPPKASVIQSSASVERRVLRPYRRTVLGSRSVKMRRRQSHPPQKNFRVCKEIRTGMPSQGRSPSSRTYRLCTRLDMLWHAEQTADARQVRRRISMVPSLGRSKTSSTSDVSGNSVPRPIGRNGEGQSYSLSTPRRRRWKESPNVRMNHKSTEKYALDRVSGVSWEFPLFAFSSLFKRPFAPDSVQIWEKKWRRQPSDLWAYFPRVALSTRARCGLQKNRFFYRALSGVCCLSQSRYQARFHWGSCHFPAHERWVVHRMCEGCPVKKLGCAKTLIQMLAALLCCK